MRRMIAIALVASACMVPLELNPQPGQIAAFGDSITAGSPGPMSEAWPALLGASLPAGYSVENRGVPGETSLAIARRVAGDSLAAIDMAIIWAGRNDLNDPARSETEIRDGLRANLAAIAGVLRPRVRQRLLFLTILNGDFGGLEARGSKRYDLIMQMNRDLLRKYPFNSFDIRSALVDSGEVSDVPAARFRVDPVHLSAEGNARVAALLAQQISIRGW